MKLTAAGFTPAPNRIFCRVMEPEKKESLMKRESGIYVPEEAQGQARDPKTLAEVISVGSEIKTPMKSGDVLYYYPHGGQLFTLENKEYLTLMEGEVLGVFAGVEEEQ